MALARSGLTCAPKARGGTDFNPQNRLEPGAASLGFVGFFVARFFIVVSSELVVGQEKQFRKVTKAFVNRTCYLAYQSRLITLIVREKNVLFS